MNGRLRKKFREIVYSVVNVSKREGLSVKRKKGEFMIVST